MKSLTMKHYAVKSLQQEMMETPSARIFKSRWKKKKTLNACALGN